MNSTTFAPLHDSGTGVRFSRRLGEQVADAHYACAVTRPRHDRRRLILGVWLGIIALLAVGVLATMAS